MSVGDILEEYGREVKLQHAAWAMCLTSPAGVPNSVAVAETQRLNAVLIDVHRHLSQIRRSDILADLPAVAYPGTAIAAVSGSAGTSMRTTRIRVRVVSWTGISIPISLSENDEGFWDEDFSTSEIFEIKEGNTKIKDWKKLRKRVPPVWRAPKIPLYKGNIDPEDHLHSFRINMEDRTSRKDIWCRVFRRALTGDAIAWYGTLPARSVHTINQSMIIVDDHR